jgi:hypothetical protein
VLEEEGRAAASMAAEEARGAQQREEEPGESGVTLRCSVAIVELRSLICNLADDHRKQRFRGDSKNRVSVITYAVTNQRSLAFIFALLGVCWGKCLGLSAAVLIVRLVLVIGLHVFTPQPVPRHHELVEVVA